MPTSVIVEARLRARNQLTLPDPVVQAVGLVEGERFAVEVDPADPDTVRLHRLRPSYAGALSSVYGDPATVLADERVGWDRLDAGR
jgi:FtsP/CotA-like multicopper oxidase with cupredoxin domain